MKRPGVTSNARRIRTRPGMLPSSKCADTRYTFSLPVSEVARATNPAVFVKYADLSEYGYGVAILSESKYGFSCQGNVLRISLLRAATAPDAEQDQGSSCLCDDDGCRLALDGKLLGKHEFSWAVLPHRGHFLESHVPIAAYLFNSPLHGEFHHF